MVFFFKLLGNIRDESMDLINEEYMKKDDDEKQVNEFKPVSYEIYLEGGHKYKYKLFNELDLNFICIILFICNKLQMEL